MKKWSSRLISGFKWILSIFMMYAGISTAISPIVPIEGTLDFLYNSRTMLVLIGIAFFVSGAILFYGKWRKKRKATGIGLMAIYLCFVFATILQAIVYAGDPAAWISNFIVSMITGALWLRWKFQTEYVDPKIFDDLRRQIEQERYEAKRSESD